MAEIAYYLLGFKHIATNIKIYASEFPIQEITNLDTLRSWAKDTRGRKLFIFDEVAKTMPRRKPMASLTVDLLNDFQIIRKYKLSVICTTITEKQTDSGILDPSIIDGVWEKFNFKNPKVAQYDDFLEGFSIRVYDIPRTHVKFDTYSSALFTKHGIQPKPKFKDVDVERLWDWSHGKTCNELGLHPQQLNRLTRKFIKKTLESQHHTSQ